jgi:hypothetical protein
MKVLTNKPIRAFFITSSIVLTACGGGNSDPATLSTNNPPPVGVITPAPSPGPTSTPTGAPNPSPAPTPTPTSSPAPSPSPTASPAPTPTGAPPPVGVPPIPGTTLPPAGARLSRAYKEVMDRHYASNPLQAGECSREVHERYWTYGPDGKVYPTWHPPVDPVTGCAFGHEHGDDPASSQLSSAPMPFGFVNEKLFELDLVNFRDEDHVGHKVLVQNGAPFGAFGQLNGVRCDLMVKFHQGTHSRDALANNLHEVFYYATCNNGINVRWQNLHAFGPPGEAFTTCTQGPNNYLIATGAAVPPNSPTGGGQRNIPDNGCMTASSMYVAEDWPIDLDYTFGNGQGSFGFGMYLQVANPSRYVDLSSTAYNIGRISEVCYQQTAAAYNHPECVAVRALGQVAWNDPRSPWKGTIRRVHINNLAADIPGSNPIWYTDVFGKQFSQTRDPARGIVVQQSLAGRLAGANEGPQLDRDHSHRTVRAPN